MGVEHSASVRFHSSVLRRAGDEPALIPEGWSKQSEQSLVSQDTLVQPFSA